MIIYTFGVFQCIVLTQHHDYVQGTKPGRREKQQPVLISVVLGVKRAAEATRQDSYITVVFTKNGYGFLHLLRLLHFLCQK